MEYWLSIVPLIGVSLILALSCYLVLLSGELSFGQQAFFGIGAYVAAMLTTMAGVDLFSASLIGAAIAGMVAWLIGHAALRSSGFQFTIFTLVFGEFAREAVARFSWKIERGGRTVGPDGVLGFSGIDYFYERAIGTAAQAVLVAIAAALCFVAVWALTASRFGERVEAVAADEVLAAASGIDAGRVKLQVFALAGFVAGIGGALFAHVATSLDPANLSLMFGVHAVAYTLIGGMGSVFGPLIGTVADVLFLEWLRVFGGYRMVLFGTLIVAMMILRPQGLLRGRR